MGEYVVGAVRYYMGCAAAGYEHFATQYVAHCGCGYSSNGPERVGSDTVLFKFFGPCQGHHAHIVLAHGVAYVGGYPFGVHIYRRRQGEDVWVGALAEEGYAMLGNDECASDVDVVHEVEPLGVGLLCVAEGDGGGIVDEYVYTTKEGYCLLHGAEHLLFVAYVALHCQTSAAGFVYFLCYGMYGSAEAWVFFYGFAKDYNVSALASEA